MMRGDGTVTTSLLRLHFISTGQRTRKRWSSYSTTLFQLYTSHDVEK